MRLIDRRGERYERLLVIERAPNAGPKDTNARWVCRCDCGRQVIAYGQDLARDKHKSCGCLNAQRIYKHGMSYSPLHLVWRQMRDRCRNPNHPSFHNYGGRGIKVSVEWETFATFYADMGYPPRGASLERKDNDGPYSKDNCCWATPKEQHNNKRSNRMLTVFGRTQTLAQWADECGIPWTTLRGRLDRYGWPAEQAVTRKQQPGRRLEN